MAEGPSALKANALQAQVFCGRKATHTAATALYTFFGLRLYYIAYYAKTDVNEVRASMPKQTARACRVAALVISPSRVCVRSFLKL